MLTNIQKQTIANLRLQGLTYAEIAIVTELSPNTIKSFCRRRHPYRLVCYCCGKEFISFGNKKKKFCSREFTGSRKSRSASVAYQ